jgi:phosphosulfolactate synthase
VGPPFPLDLPVRAAKPRRVGLTQVLDKGMAAPQVADVLAVCGAYVDVWKFGWGTAYLDPHLAAKLTLLAEHDVLGCLGGTLLEIAWAQRRVDDFLGWAVGLGMPSVEVSRGAVLMEVDEKHDLIRRATGHFTVLSEVGRKSRTSRMGELEWGQEVAGDIAAGATWVVAEGRESGTVGIFDDDGAVHEDIVASAVGAGGLDRLIFEAPRRDQQAWFLNRFGPNVNLGNIAVADVLGLETLRLGLRADTIGLSTKALRPPVVWTASR